MYCSTCGSRVVKGRAACDTCGAPLLRGRAPVGPVGAERDVATAIGHCPRCGFRGEGLPYFSRGSHIAGLVFLAFFTAGMMGMGAVAYFLFRREHLVCPRCGKSWGPMGERALPQGQGPDALPAAAVPSPAAESQYQGWSIFLFLLAAVLAVAGIYTTTVPALLAAGGAAAGGLLLQRGAERAREKRRAALLAALQLPVLRLAEERKGRLTVTEVAAALEWPMRRAEKVLQSLDDGFRVSSEVTDEGLIVYEFRELVLGPGRPELPAD